MRPLLGIALMYVSFSAKFISEDLVLELHLEAGREFSGKLLENEEFPVVAQATPAISQ